MRVSYSPGYYVPLPPGHRFPMAKFPALHDMLLAEGLVKPDDVVEPQQAEWTDLCRVHTAEYLTELARGTLDPRDLRRLGLPWSPGLNKRSRLAVQGTLNAATFALDDGIAANLAGGTHHAFADRGEGFCVLNDVAVTARVLLAAGRVRRLLVLDLDVHQGNGTAECLADTPAAFTFSMHGEKNYPFRKSISDRDVPLPNDLGDEGYLAILSRELPRAIAAARPDLVIYLAGVDVVEGDRFGRLGVTRAGLRERERLVLETLRAAGLPVCLLLSGGYAVTPEATADLHAEVHRVAAGMT